MVILDSSASFDAIRVLVELGRQDTELILPLIQQALASEQTELHWLALYELFEAGKLRPAQLMMLLKQVLQQDPLHAQFANTRVLIELGKVSPQRVSPFLEKALASDQVPLQWAAMLELAQLAKVHPAYFSPMLEQAALSEQPHIQWLSLLTLLKVSQQFSPAAAMLQQLVKTEKVGELSALKAQINVNLDQPGSAFVWIQSALTSQQPDLQWQATLILVELAKSYPTKSIYLLEAALASDNAHVQWLAALALRQLAQRFPEQQPLICSPLLSKSDSDLETTRVLVELSQEYTTQTMTLLKQALESDQDPLLQRAALYELTIAYPFAPADTLSWLEQFFQRKTAALRAGQVRLLVELGKDNQPEPSVTLLKRALTSYHHTTLQQAAFKEYLVLLKQGFLNTSEMLCH